MTKKTRTKIPPEIARVYDAFTGELKFDKVALLQAEITELKGELLLTQNALANATAKLQNSRQHRTEVNQDG